MKVLDFGSGHSLLAGMHWGQNLLGGRRFISQSFLGKMLYSEHVDIYLEEIHCYDSVSILPEESGLCSERLSDVVLHSDVTTLPVDIDIICALNPNPRVVFGTTDAYGGDTPQYDAYISDLALVTQTCLKVRGILVVQFERSMLPPAQRNDGEQIFLQRLLEYVSSNVEKVFHMQHGVPDALIEPFRSQIFYEFTSLHVFKKRKSL